MASPLPKRFLVNSSVVLLAELNNPALFTLDYLRHIGVIEVSDRIEGATTLPPVSQIRFGEYMFEAVEQRIKIERFINSPSHELADDYLLDERLTRNAGQLARSETVAAFQLASVGLNFRLIHPEADLDALIDLDNLPSGATSGELKLIFNDSFEGSIMNIDMQKILISRNNTDHSSKHGSSISEIPGIQIDANFHINADMSINAFDRSKIIASSIEKRSQFFNHLLGIVDDFNFS